MEHRKVVRNRPARPRGGAILTAAPPCKGGAHLMNPERRARRRI